MAEALNRVQHHHYGNGNGNGNGTHRHLHRHINNNKVCIHWLNGRCNRYPCPFRHYLLHSYSQSSTTTNRLQENPNNPPPYPCPPRLRGRLVWTNPNPNPNSNSNSNSTAKVSVTPKSTTSIEFSPAAEETTVVESDAKAQQPDAMASSSLGDSFSLTLLTPLQGHHKAVTGITLPSGSDKLFSASTDETVRVWDCHTGNCVETVNMGGEVGCMIHEGPWIFIGIPNAVKVWNTQTSTGLTLDGPTGQVNALVFANDMLFAGIQDGSILAWRFNSEGNCFEAAASLTGHQQSVVTLVVGRTLLYSASMDHTIKVWDLTTLQCIQTLTDHTSPVMSLLCWDQFLLSGSLDQTIKVWAGNENGNIEVIYTHNEQHGVVALSGMPDAHAKPVLFCSCNDNTVRLFDLPSFNDRGKIYSKEEVRATAIAPDGLFFMGDAAGELKVWKWSVHKAEAPSDSHC